jgi:hypothetical protein
MIFKLDNHLTEFSVRLSKLADMDIHLIVEVRSK